MNEKELLKEREIIIFKINHYKDLDDNELEFVDRNISLFVENKEEIKKLIFIYEIKIKEIREILYIGDLEIQKELHRKFYKYMSCQRNLINSLLF